VNGYEALDQGNGGSDFSLVQLDRWGKPECQVHGAMNKVSPSSNGGLWRCLQGTCRAGCKEAERDG
jgi:hypothetical protein